MLEYSDRIVPIIGSMNEAVKITSSITGNI